MGGLRIGILLCDWAAQWLEQLHLAGVPGADYILPAPTSDLTDFKAKPATYSDISAGMRAALMATGLPAKVAVQYTPQSWRHIYPTIGRQLQLPEAWLDDMGHWEAGSGMPRRYDAMACVSELAAKSSIILLWLPGGLLSPKVARQSLRR